MDYVIWNKVVPEGWAVIAQPSGTTLIWKGCQILKLELYFVMFIHFFDFCWIKKKDIFIEIAQPFLYLEGALKYISKQH